MELGLIKKVDIDSEMQQSYLDYAMSVIVSRALPDARDGLKPVQRRILYAMYDMGIRATTGYKKSARIVGEVLGKYHPHGDMAVYEAMARMAQDFSMRYMLVDGQGNFGSVDGDPPAAMRYTEARLTAPAIDMLNQIEKNTVNFLANFDDTLEEPVVLPAAIPNLLVNGATGIAVGMATNIPPHNLGEVVDALIYMLQQWDNLDDVSIDTLMKFIQGPDFPTGGIIIQDPLAEGLTSAYVSGRGRVIVQARAHMEEMVRGRNRIIVTELPYTVNKASLIERIAEIVREGGLEGVSDLRDESDRQGMRIVIELSKTAEPEKVLRELYHRTPMKSTFGINMLALVDGEPRLLSLKQALRVYLEHRLVVVKRRAEFDLEKAKARAHILEGLRIALQNLDEIIALIRSSPDADQARVRLIKKFRLSEIQAQAILDMPLRRLAALERKKIEQEYKEVTDQIRELESLLRSPKKMRQVVSEDLTAVKTAYADRRRTQIATMKEGETITNLLTTTDLTPSLSVYISITEDGRISRTREDSPPSPVEGQKPYWLLQSNTHDTLYLAASNGKTAAIPVHAVPAVDDFTQGIPLPKACALTDEDPLACVFSLPPKNGESPEGYIVTVSRAGLVKKTAAAELPGPSAQTFLLSRVNDGDFLGWSFQTSGEEEIILATRKGMAIRFSEDDVRPMGLVAAGVGGIKLSAGDELIGAFSIKRASEVMMVLSDGRAKRVALKEFPVQSRYGQGVIAWKLGRDQHVAGVLPLIPESHLIVYLSRTGAWDLTPGSVPATTRAGQGKLAVKAVPGEEVLTVLDLPLVPPASPKPASAGKKPRKEVKTGTPDGKAGLDTAAAAPPQGKALVKKTKKCLADPPGKAGLERRPLQVRHLLSESRKSCPGLRTA